MVRHWYVIQSKPKQEERVESNLRMWQIETLFPKLLKPARSGRRRKPRVEPLFPGYLFAHFDADETLAKMRYTRGLARILGTADGPTPLTDHAIDMITDRMDPSGIVTLTSSLRRGDRVRITAGPFRDFLAVFDHSATAEQRVTVLLATLNAQVRLALDSDLVEPVA